MRRDEDPFGSDIESLFATQKRFVPQFPVQGTKAQSQSFTIGRSGGKAEAKKAVVAPRGEERSHVCVIGELARATDRTVLNALHGLQPLCSVFLAHFFPLALIDCCFILAFPACPMLFSTHRQSRFLIHPVGQRCSSVVANVLHSTPTRLSLLPTIASCIPRSDLKTLHICEVMQVRTNYLPPGFLFINATFFTTRGVQIRPTFFFQPPGERSVIFNFTQTAATFKFQMYTLLPRGLSNASCIYAHVRSGDIFRRRKTPSIVWTAAMSLLC
jgi:hypothetical protein